MRILAAAGGTGGHIYPAVAIVEKILELAPDSIVRFVGSANRIEARIIPGLGYSFTSVRSAPFPRRFSAQSLRNLSMLIGGVGQSASIIKEFRPDAILVTGAYICVPPAVAGGLLGVPVFVQEQNLIPGAANRLVGKWATRIYLGFREASRFFDPGKVEVVGNPIRFKRHPRDEIIRKFGLNSDRRTIFVMGGSQGARTINLVFARSLDVLLKSVNDLQVVHQTGESDYDDVVNMYRDCGMPHLVRPYFDEISEVYSIADLMVCRTGAMTVSEMTAYGIPAVMIPFPHATDDHQTTNARAVESAGAGVMIGEDELTQETLVRSISNIMGDPAKLRAMADASRRLGNSNAALDIAKSIIEIIRR